MTRKRVLRRLVPSASSWAAAGRSSTRSWKGQSFPLSCVLSLSSIRFGGTQRGARWQRRLLPRVLAPALQCVGRGVPAQLPRKSRFCLDRPHSCSSCRPLGVNNLCRFSFPLVDVSLHHGEIGAGAGGKGREIGESCLPLCVFRQFGLWYVVPPLLYVCVFVVLVGALFSRFLPLCGKFRGILVPEGLHSHFPSSVSLLVGSWALTPELCLRIVI